MPAAPVSDTVAPGMAPTGRYRSWNANGEPRLLVLVYLRLFPQNGVQQRTVDFDLAVVVDVALFAKFVHEKTYPGTRGADHFRQRFLAEGDRERLFAVIFAEIRQQQKQAREASFAGIEELVDQVVFDPAVSGQQIGDEKCGELRLRTEHPQHSGLCYRSDQALFHRLAGCGA